MIITIKAEYEKHSIYKGVQIYKRKARTGTHGGMWKTASTTCKSLGSAKKWIDHLERTGNLQVWMIPQA